MKIQNKQGEENEYERIVNAKDCRKMDKKGRVVSWLGGPAVGGGKSESRV